MRLNGWLRAAPVALSIVVLLRTLSAEAVMANPQVNSRARDLSDAANRETAKNEQLAPYLLAGFVVLVLVIGIFLYAKRDKK